MHNPFDFRLPGGRSTKPGKPCACRALCRLGVSPLPCVYGNRGLPPESRTAVHRLCTAFQQLSHRFSGLFHSFCTRGAKAGLALLSRLSSLSTWRDIVRQLRDRRWPACRLGPHRCGAVPIHRLPTAFTQLIQRYSGVFHSFSTGGGAGCRVRARIVAVRHQPSIIRAPHAVTAPIGPARKSP